MRAIYGLILLAGSAAVCSVGRGDEPKQDELLAAVQQRLRQTVATAGPTIATVVVSRSEHYGKPANGSTPGKLGAFDPKEFMKPEPGLERARLARSLDLSDVQGIAEHGYSGGVVIDPEGFVLTPYHVIDGATKVYVFLSGGVGSYADIHAADARSDLAVLKLINPPPKLQAIKFGDVQTVTLPGQKPTVFTGKLCVLMTNPYTSTFGLGQPTAGFGSITNVRVKANRKEDDAPAARITEYGTLLEYDIKQNSGITGGVLLNLDSEMIGLTNAAAVAWGNDVGPGYAMPATASFRRIVDVLRRGEEVEYGFLGVTLNRQRQGVWVDQLTQNGPADRAEIEVGDQIIKLNGLPIDSFHDLLLQVGSALAGSKVKVTVSRFGRIREQEVTLAKFRHDLPFIASVRPEPVFGLRVDYASTRSQEINRIPADVCVRDLVADSPAATKFKTLGDTPTRWLISHVNGNPIANPAEFYKATKGQDKVKLTLLDSTEPNGRPRELTLP